MFDQQDGDGALETAKERNGGSAFCRSQSGHRLVEQKQLRPGRKRDRKLKLLLLAVRHFAHHDAGALVEPYTRKRMPGLFAESGLAACVRPKMKAVTQAGLHGERHIVERRILGQQFGDLKRTRQAERERVRQL